MSVEMVPVTELMKRLISSQDGYDLSYVDGWFSMMRNKGDDPQIPALIRLIQEHGFTDPIGIELLDESLPWNHPDAKWHMGNGHHRLVVSILLGLDAIPVVFGNGWPAEGFQEYKTDRERRYEDWEEAEWIASHLPGGLCDDMYESDYKYSYEYSYA